MEHIKTRIDKGIGFITLDRPDALNALSLSMIDDLAKVLDQFVAEDSIHTVWIEGAGNRAFCAGGDVRSAYVQGQRFRAGEIGLVELTAFFDREYALNRQIYHFQKPYFAFLNGITMGGGYGVSGPGRHLIATDKTVFAMPEAQSGLYPDIGATYFLSRLPHHIGMYLALTGVSISGAEMALIGLAQYYAGIDRRDDILAMIPHVDTWQIDGKPAISDYIDIIDRCFGGAELAAIIDALETHAAENDFICDALARMKRASPLSLCVTHAHMMRARGADFDRITHWDCAMTAKFMQNSDFFEGVRAQLIDKDKNPAWMHRTIADVPQAMVDDMLG